MVTNSLARYYKKTKKERKKLWKKIYEIYQNLSQKEKKERIDISFFFLLQISITSKLVTKKTYN